MQPLYWVVWGHFQWIKGEAQTSLPYAWQNIRLLSSKKGQPLLCLQFPFSFNHFWNYNCSTSNSIFGRVKFNEDGKHGSCTVYKQVQHSSYLIINYDKSASIGQPLFTNYYHSLILPITRNNYIENKIWFSRHTGTKGTDVPTPPDYPERISNIDKISQPPGKTKSLTSHYRLC